jgi:NAD(P)-dependent dehydrogenase (short-subunit alcohol dehydrogenase family)
MTWPTIDLTDKRILVTGASSGIGASVAATVAAAGANVALVARDATRLAATAASVREHGREALELIADLTEDGVAVRLVADTVKEFGGLDGVLNAAGVFYPEPIAAGVASLDRHWGPNVRAPYALAAAAIPHLRGGAGGSFVFVSSVGGRMGFPECSAYGATKGAIEALVKCLAVEEAPNGIRVNAIAPGNIRTRMNAHLFEDPEYEAQEMALTPLKRIGEVDDIAPAAAFLLSDHASYITGHSLVIDGGVLAS